MTAAIDALPAAPAPAQSFGSRVMKAVLWRSGSQVVAQLVMWLSTFFVIRTLSPSDYGLVAMTQSVLVFLSLLSGQGFAGSLIGAKEVDERRIAQVFGMMLALNGAVAIAQLCLAPLAAAYYHQPIVAEMLRVQALLYFANPLIALPGALLSRALDYRRQAKVNMLATGLGALTSLVGALSGWGVWALVSAPLVVAGTRAIGLTLAARMLVWPSFRFQGAGATLRFGGAMFVSSLLWLVQTQSDVLIGGRVLDAHRIGIYTTALFLSQIVTSKFIPPLNEVAFSAYARLQDRAGAPAYAFEKAARLILLCTLPIFLGMAVAADPLVRTVLGSQWVEVGPVVAIVALAMPFVTLQVLFAPATTALGHPRFEVFSSAMGALIMPVAFAIGVRSGVRGLAAAWMIGVPLLTCITVTVSSRVIGTNARALLRAVAPPLACALGMAAVVMTVDRMIVVVSPELHLGVLVATGAASYAALVWLIARPALRELLALPRMMLARN